MASSSLSFLLLFITVHLADGFLYYHTARCVFNSTELKDIEYIRSFYYNKLELIRFSSSLGKFVGYTEFGVKTAEQWNKDTALLSAERAQKEVYCLPNTEIWYTNVLSKSVEPYVVLHSTAPPPKQHPAVLVCSVYDFYPKVIKVSWFRDEQEVTSGVSSTGVMEDGDWYYQIHSRLEYTPRKGEKIACVVEHASLKGPLRTYWNPSMPKSDKEKIAIGASALILGLVFGLAGFIYYRNHTPDLFLLDSEKTKIAIKESGLTLDQVLSLAKFIYSKKKAQGRILCPS
ncbi:H-2 class II histocompatibility antigen, E-S beta chain-like [Acanthochromis polyacanthus]|uniref:H-2 class II histocompatibility antigen, E-S beta chain-like n=1 Tax=Acanthochromis polyacanthus TaxID=80966 RepID=UPI00223449AD|nr:H-2 class II histocompatibility antigen, E-S beta chain-like [Acanthochromis polyacanthus]